MTDEALALKAQENDYDSEIELFSRYKTAINQISRSFFLVGGDTEDLIQEGMIGLYRAIKAFSYEKNATFATFAHICIRRQIQNAIKQASAKKNQALLSSVPLVEAVADDDDVLGAGLILPSPDPTPDAQMISSENMRELKKKILNALSGMELKILKRYLSGENYLEIATNLNIKKKSVDNALSRIKSKLSFLKNDY